MIIKNEEDLDKNKNEENSLLKANFLVKISVELRNRNEVSDLFDLKFYDLLN